jgi:hypothetical protein
VGGREPAAGKTTAEPVANLGTLDEPVADVIAASVLDDAGAMETNLPVSMTVFVGPGGEGCARAYADAMSPEQILGALGPALPAAAGRPRGSGAPPDASGDRGGEWGRC